MNHSTTYRVRALAETSAAMCVVQYMTPVIIYRSIVGIAVAAYFLQRAADLSGEGAVSQVLPVVACAALNILAMTYASATIAVAANLFSVLVCGLTSISSMDDYVANIAPLTVAMVLSTNDSDERQKTIRVVGVGAVVVAATVVAVYMGGGPTAVLGNGIREPTWVPWIFRAVAVGLVAPNAALGRASVVLQVALHTYLLTVEPCRLTHLVFAASACLFVMAKSDPKRVFRADVASVIGLTIMVIAVQTFVGGCVLGKDVSRSERVLAVVGLLPFPMGASQAQPYRASGAESRFLDVSSAQGSQ